MKNIFLVILLLLVGRVGVFGQWRLVLSEKIVNSSFNAFQPLVERGYPGLDEGMVHVRTGMKFSKGRMSIFPNVSLFLSSDKNESKLADLIGYGVGVGFQYSLFDWKDFKVYSGVELGAESYHLKYTNLVRTTTLGGFKTTISKVEAFHFVNLGIYQDIAIGLEKYYPLKKIEFGAGFEIGYRFNQGKWKIKDDFVTISDKIFYHNGTFFGINLHIRRNR